MIRISTTAIQNGLIDANRRVAEATVNGSLDMSALESSYARSYARVSRLEGAVVPALSLWDTGVADHIALAFANRAAEILGVTLADVDSPEKLRRFFTLAQSPRESFSRRTAGYLGVSQDDRKADVMARTPEKASEVTPTKSSPFETFKSQEVTDDSGE